MCPCSWKICSLIDLEQVLNMCPLRTATLGSPPVVPLGTVFPPPNVDLRPETHHELSTSFVSPPTSIASPPPVPPASRQVPIPHQPWGWGVPGPAVFPRHGAVQGQRRRRTADNGAKNLYWMGCPIRSFGPALGKKKYTMSLVDAVWEVCCFLSCRRCFCIFPIRFSSFWRSLSKLTQQ